jgi:WD40 repeat protein
VLPHKPGPKPEPIAPNLIASLVHPDRKAHVWGAAFSPDGTRLSAYGYPSGIVQIWDVASKREIRRIDTPAGPRGSMEYALLTPHWDTLYVPAAKRAIKAFERAGKVLRRFEQDGAIRVWDVASGKEKEPLSTPGSTPLHAKLAPAGRLLVCVEEPSYDSDVGAKHVTMVWDLTSGKKWKLTDGYAFPSFNPDEQTVLVSRDDPQAKTASVQVLDLATGKELAKLNCQEKDRFFSIGSVAPDGAVAAINLGGKKGAPFEVWFRDARTLEDRGKLVAKGDPSRYGWATGRFTPDARWFVVIDGAGDILLWNVAARKVQRTLSFAGDRWTNQWATHLAVAPDSTMLAVGWMPKTDSNIKSVGEPDPHDLPQPRVSLLDLEGSAPPRTLIARHGSTAPLAFSPDGRLLAFGSTGAIHLFDLSK